MPDPMHTEDSIPAALRPPATAALAWINETQQQAFRLTDPY